MDYGSVHRVLSDTVAARAVPEWTLAALDDVAAGHTGIRAVRHPLGFLCIPLERAGGHGVCVHVWSDDLAHAEPTTSQVHAHSWDLLSHVLYGSVRNELIGVTDAGDVPTHRVFEVRSSGDVDEIRRTSRLVSFQTTAVGVHEQGDTYSLPAGAFHATVITGEAATVALGSDRPGIVDLSLGAITTSTHQLRRQRCGHDETARAASLVAARLAARLAAR